MLKATWDWYYGSAEEELLGNCQFGEPYAKSEDDSKLIVRSGTYENGDAVNIFTLKQQAHDDATNLETSAQYLKVLRHPNILRFVACLSMELEYHLITEHAYPLKTLLNVIDAHEICSGLHDIALALQFIHEKASITHNNVCIDNVFVDDNGPWKLAGFEFACRFDDATEECLNQNSSYRPPPEEKGPRKIKLPLTSQFGHCRDVYNFGVMLDEFFDKVQFSTAMLKDSLQEVVEDITREDYQNRPNMKEILTMPIFKSAYISIIHFLQSITLRNSVEKENFFKTLITKLDINHIFAEVIGRRIVPLLLTPIVLAERSAIRCVINSILTPAIEYDAGTPLRTATDGILPESVFARYVIPKVVELFKSRLIHVRLVLLENFSKFVHLFEKSILNEIILPEVLTGLHDTSNQVVQFSLHALADAVAVVGADVIVGEEREKIFSPGTPKFDGCALNESRALAYKEKIPPRKKVKKPQPPPPPRKPTLLELAMLKNCSVDDRPAPTVEILMKQKQLAHQIAAKSQVTPSRLSNSCTPQKQKRSQIVVQEIQQPDVETWASSSDDDSDMQWPDMNENSYPNNRTETPPPTDLIYPFKESNSSTSKHEDNSNSSISHSSYHCSSSQSALQLVGNHLETKADPSKLAHVSCIHNEVDFFADMEPNVQSSLNSSSSKNSTVVLNHLHSNGMETESLGRTPFSSFNSAFRASNVNDEEEGWSDDGW